MQIIDYRVNWVRRLGRQRAILWFLRKLANGGQSPRLTFLMVFVIQNSQNRDGLALHIKLDEIIRAVGTAHNEFIDLEDRSHDVLDEIKARFSTLAVKARKAKGMPPSRQTVKTRNNAKRRGTNSPATD